MATVTVATALYAINLTIVAISLPHMQGTFSATRDQISWVITAFIVGHTSMIIFSGWLAARVGRKRLYLASIAAFTLMSLMCGNAGSLEEEVFWRFLQGVAGAPLVPLSQAFLIDIYPRESYARALGIWSIGSMAGPVIAPPIGGFLTDAFGWPAVFYLNLPLGVLALVGAVLFLPRARIVQTRRLDWFGFTALLIGLGAFQLMLNRGSRLDWLASVEVVTELAVALLFLYLFAVHMFTARNPFLTPRMFADRNFSVGIVLNFCQGAVTFLPVVMLPLMLQGLAGYPIEEIGLLLVPRALGIVLASVVAGPLIARFDARFLAAAGFALMATSFWAMGQWTLDVDAWAVTWTGAIVGIGSGVTWICINYLAFATLAPRVRDEVIPLYYLAFNLAVSVGIAGIITYWTISSRVNQVALVERITPFNQLLRAPFTPEAWSPESTTGAAALESEIARQAAMIGFDNSQYLTALITIAFIPLVLFLRLPPREAAAV